MSTMTIDFSREVPLFPLPNLVLLPSAVQALHIFEPRYRAMISAVLDGPGLMALALLQPGWEKTYYSNPAIHGVVCLGRVVSHEAVEEGNYNVLVQGMLRAQVAKERKEGPYRVALLEPLADLPVVPGREAIHRAAISEMFTHGAFAEHSLAEGIRNLLSHSVPVAAVTDILAFTFLQDVAAKQRLLEELDPNARADAMIGILTELARVGQIETPETKPWPPPLGAN